MTSEQSKFRFSAQEGIIELEGSEGFISSHMETLTDLIRIISRCAPADDASGKYQSGVPGAEDEKIEIQDRDNDHSIKIENYPKIYSKINEKLKIICKIPGSNKRERSRNVALLYCYGSYLAGDDQIFSDEIRTLCQEHGTLDAANFSKALDDNTIFLLDGKKGGKKQVKLTYVGREKAEELVKDLSK